MKFINMTPHEVSITGGATFPPSGKVARVGVSFSEPCNNGFVTQNFDDVIGLPDYEENTYLIVSLMVLEAASSRSDLVSPASGHPDTVRNEKGQIVSVPYFVKK